MKLERKIDIVSSSNNTDTNSKAGSTKLVQLLACKLLQVNLIAKQIILGWIRLLILGYD